MGKQANKQKSDKHVTHMKCTVADFKRVLEEHSDDEIIVWFSHPEVNNGEPTLTIRPWPKLEHTEEEKAKLQ